MLNYLNEIARLPQRTFKPILSHYAWWKGMRHANLVDDDKLMTRKYESYKQKH